MLPDTIRIGLHDYAIVKWNSNTSLGRGRSGECASIEQEIRLSSGHPSCTQLIDTFLHEALHAVYWVYGVHDEDKEERVVSVFSTALTTLFRDNPWLASWIEKYVGR